MQPQTDASLVHVKIAQGKVVADIIGRLFQSLGPAAVKERSPRHALVRTIRAY